ncbi:unnamed protein product [Rotaria sp. Silwood1]|nr:unnamed protein product [Rotaria sp. Silwood1]
MDENVFALKSLTGTEHNLYQFVEQLKQLVYWKIFGKIAREKVKSYRLMIQTRFPNSQIDIQILKCRLWM